MKRAEIKNIFNTFSVSKIILIILLIPAGITSVYSETFLTEEFNDLSMWEEMTFPKIERHSTYYIDGKENILVVKSDNSASGIIHKAKIDIYKYPEAEWMWKIEEIIKNGNALEKKGDDYSIRIYILFKYDKTKSKLGERLKYGTAKLLYGQYPPHSALNYIWSNKNHSQKYIENSYTDKAVMIPLNSGNEDAGKWIKNTVNIYNDYKNAFKKEPPQYAYIAVMGDSDDTGEKSTAYIDYIRIFN